MGKERYKQYYQGGYYHIYNRGVGKQNVFKEEQDFIVYLKRLREYRDKHAVTILCYCLMPNHVHLVVRQNTEQPVYKFIQSLHTSYGMYFNKKYDRVGSLWQDRFKQKNILKDNYLLYLSFYIHFNPLLDKLVMNLDEYDWSSYLDYTGKRKGTLCEYDTILQGQSFTEYLHTMWLMKNTITEYKTIKSFIKDCP